MKQNDLILIDRLEYENPWQIFKKKELPIGLAEAFKEQQGYDPLKTCRRYLWLRNLRMLSWQWTAVVGVMGLISIPLIAQVGLKPYLGSLGITPASFWVITVATLLTLLLLTVSRKAYKQCEGRMWRFRRCTCGFVWEFKHLFESDPTMIHGGMNKDKLAMIVHRDLLHAAREVVVKEVNDEPTSVEKHLLGLRSAAANPFGLGCAWGPIFDEAKRTVNTYEHFTWEI